MKAKWVLAGLAAIGVLSKVAGPPSDGMLLGSEQKNKPLGSFDLKKGIEQINQAGKDAVVVDAKGNITSVVKAKTPTTLTVSSRFTDPRLPPGYTYTKDPITGAITGLFDAFGKPVDIGLPGTSPTSANKPPVSQLQFGLPPGVAPTMGNIYGFSPYIQPGATPPQGSVQISTPSPGGGGSSTPSPGGGGSINPATLLTMAGLQSLLPVGTAIGTGLGNLATQGMTGLSGWLSGLGQPKPPTQYNMLPGAYGPVQAPSGAPTTATQLMNTYLGGLGSISPSP